MQKANKVVRVEVKLSHIITSGVHVFDKAKKSEKVKFLKIVD